MKKLALILSLFLTSLASFAAATSNNVEKIGDLPQISLIAGGTDDKSNLPNTLNRYRMAQDGDNVYIAFSRSQCSNNGGVPSVLHLQKGTKNLTALDGVNCIKPTPGASNGPNEYIADDLQIAINPKTKQPVIAFISRSNNNSLVVLEHECTAGSCQWYQLDAKDQKNNPLPTNIGHLSLAIDTDGNPLVAYQDRTFTPTGEGNSHISVLKIAMEFNTTKYIWSYVGNTSFSGNSRGYIYLVLDSKNQPFVAYSDEHLSVAYLPSTNNKWQILPCAAAQYNGSTGDNIDFTLINDEPVVLYQTNTGGLNFKKYNLSKKQWEQIWDKAASNGSNIKAINQAIIVSTGKILVGFSACTDHINSCYEDYDHPYQFSITDHSVDNYTYSNYVSPQYNYLVAYDHNIIFASQNSPEIYMILKTAQNTYTLFVNNQF